jgi:hypothetical protein
MLIILCHPAEVQSNYTRLQNDLQALASKIGELESEAEEHECVLRMSIYPVIAWYLTRVLGWCSRL